MDGVISVTAYRAFGRCVVLATQSRLVDGVRSYRQLTHETLELPDVEREDPADDLALIAVALWQAADRLAGTPF